MKMKKEVDFLNKRIKKCNDIDIQFNENDNTEEFVFNKMKSEYMNIYKNSKITKDVLKSRLILFKNMKLELKPVDIISTFFSGTALIVALVSIIVSRMKQEIINPDVPLIILIIMMGFVFAYMFYQEHENKREINKEQILNIYISVIEEVLSEIEKEEKVTNKEIADKLDNLENEVKRIKEFNCIE